jgi:hypothetical protein
MSEIKDRQDAASAIDPIVAALADDAPSDTWAAAAVEGFSEAAEPAAAEAIPVAGVEAPLGLEGEAADLSDGTDGDAAEPLAATDPTDDALEGEPDPAQSGPALHTAPATDALAADADADFGDEAPAEAVEAALLDGAPEPLAAAGFEHMPAAYADTIVELDVEADSDDEAPLLDSDLEDGIASVFAALHAAREDTAPVEPRDDLEASDGVTFRLLGELDRLWHRAA